LNPDYPFSTVLAKVIGVLGVMLVGAVARKQGMLRREADTSVMKLVINILVPAMFFDKVLGASSMLEPANLYLPPVLAFFTCCLGFAVAWGVVSLLGKHIGIVTPVAKRTFILCVGLYNFGYISLPLAERMYGADTQAVLIVFNFGVEAAIWSVGILIITGQLDRNAWKHLFNMPLVAIALASVVNFTIGKSNMPTAILDTMNYLGRCAIPMGLVLSGAVIFDHWRELAPTKRVPLFATAFATRIIALPVIFLGLMLLLPYVGGSKELQHVMLLQASMPAASFPIVICKHHNGDMPTAIKIILGTTLLSVITIPTWLWIGSRVLG
jgi:malate permease and related proteins